MNNWKFFCGQWVNFDHIVTFQLQQTTRMLQGNKELCWRIKGDIDADESITFRERTFDSIEDAENYLDTFFHGDDL